MDPILILPLPWGGRTEVGVREVSFSMETGVLEEVVREFIPSIPVRKD